MPTTLAIETSCDDTSVSLVRETDGEFFVDQLRSFSQVDIHQPYGGVVPELAYRSHTDKLIRLLEEIGGPELQKQIDFISVTAYPGLPGALTVGVTVAHTLSHQRDKPVVEVNHIMGHVFSILVERSRKILQLPYVCLTVSGGHNDIYLITGIDQTAQIAEGAGTSYHKRRHLAVGEAVQVGPYQVRKLGQTIDDAAGEAFDKVARMLGGPYPGGAWIDRLALQGSANKQIDLTTTFLSADSYDVSFSGIKSQVHYLLGEKDPASLSDQYKADIAWKFEDQVTHVLTKKLVQAAIDHQAQTVGLVGGVSANNRLRERVADRLSRNLPEVPLYLPTKMVYCTDNGAMIGLVGHLTHR